MPIPKIDASAKGSPAPDRNSFPLLRIRTRSPYGFAMLLTIGIVWTGLIAALMTPDRRGQSAIVGITVATTIACWAFAVFFAWLHLLFRSVVALVRLGAGILPPRGFRRKLRPRGVSTGVTDAWLDGAI